MGLLWSKFVYKDSRNCFIYAALTSIPCPCAVYQCCWPRIYCPGSFCVVLFCTAFKIFFSFSSPSDCPSCAVRGVAPCYTCTLVMEITMNFLDVATVMLAGSSAWKLSCSEFLVRIQPFPLIIMYIFHITLETLNQMCENSH